MTLLSHDMYAEVLWVDWDSKKHHDDFAASDAYGPFLQTFLSICDGEPLMFCHADFKPDASLSKVLSAPVTEFVVVYFEGGPKDDYLQNVSKFAQAVDQAQPEGYLGCSYGATYEELQKEDVKGKAVVISVGWQSVDHHMQYRETDSFKNNIGLLRGDAKKIQMSHVQFMQVHG